MSESSGDIQEAGRELDALVAERVMGLEVTRGEVVYDCGIDKDGWALARSRTEHNGEVWYDEELPLYSKSISAAWEVVHELGGKKLGGVGGTVLGFGLERTDGPRWTAAFGRFSGEARTAPLAICRAALVATAAPHESEKEK